MAGVADFYVHTVTVETRTGSGAYGDVYAAVSAPIPCLVEQSRRLVRDQDGEQVVSETTLYTDLAQAAAFTTGSRVTVNGRTSYVINAKPHDLAALGADVNHLEVVLQ